MTTVGVPAFGLSKSRVMAGLQCDKFLWWMASGHRGQPPKRPPVPPLPDGPSGA
jgi:hypothetical protein